MKRTAILYSLRASTREYGRVDISAQRTNWPEAIVFNNRVFLKATTGKLMEEYRECASFHAAQIRRNQEG